MRTARINNDGVVEQSIVGTAEWAAERLGGTWVDTETKVGIGWTYSEEHGFRPPQPFPSWLWVDGAWVAPVPYPDVDPASETYYSWSEDDQTWIKMTEPI